MDPSMDLRDLTWRSSSICNNANCVEIAMLPGRILLRDGKNPAGPVLSFDATEWTHFLNSAKLGCFDMN